MENAKVHFLASSIPTSALKAIYCESLEYAMKVQFELKKAQKAAVKGDNKNVNP